MRYTSTRDASKFYTFEEALLAGYAPDGGLFVPETLPQVDFATLHGEWSKLSFVDLATQVLLPFLGSEIPEHDLRAVLGRALEGFDDVVVPVVPIDEARRVYVTELFHGPTYCFKDLGMRMTVYLLDYFASGRSSSGTRQTVDVTLVVSTTGDTGPAAVRAVRDLDSPRLGLLVHYPEGQISDFQRKQLTAASCQSDRVKVVAFQGGGDDMDAPIKRIMTTTTATGPAATPTTMAEAKRSVVCGVNSYNIGRPLMQMVHFIWTYLRIVDDRKQGDEPPGGCGAGGTAAADITGPPATTLDDDVVVIIPTGAMGNIAGCYMARKMGVPLGTPLVAAVNINDVTDIAFRTGLVERPSANASAEPMKRTLSDAINIQLPYNLERLLFYLTDGDHKQVAAWYGALEGEGGTGGGRRMDLRTDGWLEQLQREFASVRVTDDELCATMRQILEDYEYWTDPHTGVAFCAAQKLGYIGGNGNKNNGTNQNQNRVVAIMATAAPCKFQEAVTTALGQERWEEYERDHFPASGKALRQQQETPPIVYEAEDGKSLYENQAVWETKARELIAQLAGTGR